MSFAVLKLFLHITFAILCSANSERIEFIKSFIQNEQKPTHLMFKMCGGYREEVELMKEMSKIGVRSSRSLRPSKYLDQGLLFLLDLQCPNAEGSISKAISKHLFMQPYRWLVFANSSVIKEGTVLESMPILIDSDLVLAETMYYGFRMTEIYKISKQSALQSSLRGYFNGTLVDVRPQRTLYRRRKNLLRHPLTMGVVAQESNSTLQHYEDRLELQYDYTSKVSLLNVRLAFEMLNATTRLHWSFQFGYFDNGSWSGIIKDLLDGKADVGTSQMLTFQRIKVLSFTDDMAPSSVRFVFRQPPLSYIANIFRLPFSSGVWIGLMVCTIASSIGVWAATHWEASLARSSSQLDGSFSDSLLLTMSAFCQQGCTLEPVKASGRIMTVVMFITLMAMYAAYSANIVVLLQAPSNAIQTLEQLGQSSLTLAGNDVDYNHKVLRLFSQSDPMRRKIFERIDGVKGKKKYYYHIDEGVQRIRQGLFAFHSLVDPVYRRIEDTFQEHEKCDLVEIDFMGVQNIGIPFVKNSPYLELFRVAFKQIQEFGMKDVTVSRHRTPKPKCAQRGAMFSSVGLQDMMPVNILMLYGVTISILILGFEIVLDRIVQRRKLRIQALMLTKQ